MRNIKKLILLPLLALMVLIGCERENNPSGNETINLKAVAGEDQKTYTNQQVVLKGSATGASKPISFRWSFKSSPPDSWAVIEDHEKDTARFTPDLPGIYVLELKASKNDVSNIDETTVTVLEPPTGPVILSQNISEDLVLEDIYEDPEDADYLVTADVTVNAELTVAPGVSIHFESNTGLIINPNGILIAKGTISDSIYFTGKEAVKGYWKGILFNSNNPLNELENTSVSYGGGNSFHDEPGIRANVILAGTDFSGSAIRVSGSTFTQSDGYGLYLKGLAQFNLFSKNYFSENNSASAYINPNQLHMVDLHSHFSGNNAFDGIETGGVLNSGSPVFWPRFIDGSKYILSGDLIIKSGLKIMEGASFEINAGLMIEVAETGFLDATGTDASPVTFTAQQKTMYGSWKGILFKAQNELNKLIFTDVSYAGSDILPGMANKANIAVAPTGSLTVVSSKVHDGAGYGIVASAAYQVNSDIFAANEFYGLAEGIILPAILMTPDAPSLEGHWVDWWSFTNSHLTVDTVLYDRTTNIWYHGASDPWQMNPQQGFGLKISPDGNYTWTIAMRHVSDPQCISYSAEYIKGYQTYTTTELMVSEEYWRSRFVNSCAPDQNVDTDVETGSMVLGYQIVKLHNDLTGEDYWELRLTAPDNSTFSYFRFD
jgi:hypothetical protein